MEIANLVHKVLSEEQRWLANRKPWNVRKYEEKWIQFLVFRGLLDEKGIKCVEAEYNRKGSGAFVDLFVYGKINRVAVAMEIKGPAKVSTAGAMNKLNKQIQGDARKLRQIRFETSTAKYVLALAYGTQNQVEKWLAQTPVLSLRWVLTGNDLRPIRLDDAEVLGLACFKVS